MNGIGVTGQNNTLVTRIRTVDYCNFDDELALEYYNKQGNEGSYYYTHPNSKGQMLMFNEIIKHL